MRSFLCVLFLYVAGVLCTAQSIMPVATFFSDQYNPVTSSLEPSITIITEAAPAYEWQCAAFAYMDYGSYCVPLWDQFVWYEVSFDGDVPVTKCTSLWFPPMDKDGTLVAEFMLDGVVLLRASNVIDV